MYWCLLLCHNCSEIPSLRIRDLKLQGFAMNVWSNPSLPFQQAEELYQTMLKRFRQEKSVWLKYASFLLKQGQPEATHRLLERALKALPTKERKLSLPQPSCGPLCWQGMGCSLISLPVTAFVIVKSAASWLSGRGTSKLDITAKSTCNRICCNAQKQSTQSKGSFEFYSPLEKFSLSKPRSAGGAHGSCIRYGYKNKPLSPAESWNGKWTVTLLFPALILSWSRTSSQQSLLSLGRDGAVSVPASVLCNSHPCLFTWKRVAVIP